MRKIACISLRRAAFLSCLFFALCLAAVARADILISEVLSSNGVYRNGKAYDWIELYNNGKKAVSLDGWSLSDDKDDPLKWSFPKGARIQSGGYILIYCTGEDMPAGSGSTFYANFKVSSSGETLLLSNADGALIQKLKLPKQYGNVSYGLPHGQTEYYFLPEVTPGKKNGKTGCLYRADAPMLSLSGGFYGEPVTVTASGGAGDVLRYTLDGATPTEESKVFPAKGVSFKKTGVLRVRAFNKSAVPSETVGATYFIGVERPVPVVSLISDDKYLFSSSTGALVKGTGSTPNYEKELEYPANIEYFNIDGECEINQMGTFTAAGHSARQNAQKSIALYARPAYGDEYFTFNPFPNRDYSQYKSLLLRGANSDAFSIRMRDAVFSSLAEDLDILYQDALAIEVYINGRYWGHYNLREKINKYFVAQYEGVTDDKEIDKIDILARTGRDEFVQNGDNADWLSLCEFCKTKDLNIPENLAYVAERLDIESLFTHTAFEIILGNNDFTNVRVYRVPGGKWRYLLFDVEAGFLSLSSSPMQYYLKDVDDRIQGFRHEPLAALLNVPEMKAAFLKRFAEVLETSFLWDYVESRFLPWETLFEEELMPRHIARWKHFTLGEWRKNVDAIKYYARVRPRKIVSLLKDYMHLSDQEVDMYFGDVQALLDIKNNSD